MKDYLNNQEKVHLMYYAKLIDLINDMTIEWNKRGNLTAEESKGLKSAFTWSMKSFKSITERLNENSLKALQKKIEHSELIVNDHYSIKQITKKINANIDAALEENKDYFKLVELILNYNCENCKKRAKGCEFYLEFEDRCIPTPEEGQENCKYAYTKEIVKTKANLKGTAAKKLREKHRG